MRMSFYVPDEFYVFGVPQRRRMPCVIECEVVELTRRIAPPQMSWLQRRRLSAPPAPEVSYSAFVRLPPWVTPPDKWYCLITGEVQLTVNMALNKRVPIPPFPIGVHRIVIEPEPTC
jgi:hypothetical protein